MAHIEFANPVFFWLFLLLPFLILWQWFIRHKQHTTLSFSSTEGLVPLRSWRVSLLPLLPFLKIMAFCAIVIALARPQSSKSITKNKYTEGIDIVLSVDISGSMLSKDLKPNRLEALKRVAAQFVEDRVSDRIGLVVYSGESYTRVPTTSDKYIVQESLKSIQYGEIQDGTAIGLGLATSINRLKDSKTKSKVIILMTDGVNNRGLIEPKTAAEISKEYGIRIYTIGIGTNGMALSPVAQNPDGSFQYQMLPVEIDETLLKEIAQMTGGKYFRATSNKKLEEIYKEIDTLEKSKVEELKYYQKSELFRPFALLAFLLLILEFLLSQTIFRRML